MSTVSDRLAALRREMAQRNADACRIGTADDHHSEYVCPHFMARQWLSGFTGSAGTLVVTATDAGLWTDGRYFLQAKAQLKGSGIRLFPMGEAGVPTVEAYLAGVLPVGGTLWLDGHTTAACELEKITDALRGKHVRILTQPDPVAALWKDRPPMPRTALWCCESGESRRKKLARIREAMREKADLLFLSRLEEVAWTLNLRGNDVAFTPVFYAYLALTETSAVLFCDAPIPPGIRAALTRDGVRVAPYGEAKDALAAAENKTVWADKTVNCALLSALPASCRLLPDATPVREMKSVKNRTELRREHRAQLSEALALTELLFRLKTENSPRTECSVCEELEALRRRSPDYLEPSFSTIAACGKHGAVVHYAPTKKSDVPLTGGTFFLLDAGGHYRTGTTDATRTVALGAVTEKQRAHYTAVLRGHIAVASATFGADECGDGLDSLARAPLRAMGLDFLHGTGHGVGWLLSVHESPPSIRSRPAEAPESGRIVSDEPGIYLEGQYGIRLENLLCYRKRGDRFFFEVLTPVPFDRDAVNADLLTPSERRWLNAYHRRVRRLLSPHLPPEVCNWLRGATAPV